MNGPSPPRQTLREAPTGVPLLVTGPVEAPTRARRRLAELGVREGARLAIRGRSAGGGVILAVGDGRVAVSRRLLGTIPAEPCTVAAAPTPGQADS